MKNHEIKMSFYTSHGSVNKEKDITLDEYTTMIANGVNRDAVITAREYNAKATELTGGTIRKEIPNPETGKKEWKNVPETFKDKYKAIKDKQPAVTACAVLPGEGRTKALAQKGLNGFIMVDIDEYVDDEQLTAIGNDEFTKIVHRSIGGLGVCVFVKINTEKFDESFEGLEKYYFEKFGIVIDGSTSDESRLRYMSYDPGIIVKEKSITFRKYPPKKKIKEPTVIVVESDFGKMCNEAYKTSTIIDNGSYDDWRDIGFGIADEFGEGGRDYFHLLSQCDVSRYDHRGCDRQFDKCLNSKRRGITIGTVYYHAKNAGLECYSEESKKIIRKVAQAKRRGAYKKIDDYWNEMTSRTDDLKLCEPTEENKKIVMDVHKCQSHVDKTLDGDINTTDMGLLEQFIRENYAIRINEITGKPEMENGEEFTEAKQISAYVDASKAMLFNVSKSDVFDLFRNDDIEQYNPIKSFIKQNADCARGGELNRLVKTLNVDGDIVKRELMQSMVKKWFVSMFTFMDDKYSPLVLVLQGSQGDGKSHWLENLLPDELQKMFAMAEFNGSKDDLMSMHNNLILCNDEFGGQTIKDSQKFKEIVSKNYVKYRPPYARTEHTFKRIALFCGTTNEDTFLNDTTGNRRIIPIRLTHNDEWTVDGWKHSIDQQTFNEIDKTALFIDAWNTYNDPGFDCRILREDIELLEANTEDFQWISEEHELVEKHIVVDNTGRMTSTDIKVRLIELTHIQKLNKNKFSKALEQIGAEQRKSGSIRYWNVRFRGDDEFEQKSPHNGTSFNNNVDDMPDWN